MHSMQSTLGVEDSDDDFYTTERIVKKFGCAPVQRCSKGLESMPHLVSDSKDLSGLPPSLIPLDLNVPGTKDRKSVLEDLKNDLRYSRIPVVILTTSANPQDLRDRYENGASGYVRKPANLNFLTQSIKAVIDYWYEAAVLPPSAIGAA